MTLKRMDNVGVVVDDLAAAVAFFKELGLELEGEAQVEGRSVDRLIGLDGVLSDIAMMQTSAGHGRVELTKFRRPKAAADCLSRQSCVALRDSPRETLANLSITGHLRCFSDQLVADIVQCGEPHP